MIHQAVEHITRYLNLYLKSLFDLPEDVAVVAGLVEQDGSVEAHVANKLVVSVVNIEKEALPSTFSRSTSSDHAITTIGFPPVHLNVHLLISANYPGKNYTEALKFISYAALFFQGNPIFTHENTPDMSDDLSKITMEIENLNMRDLSSLWSVISGKYLPSILYKMRMITLDSREIKAQVRTMTGADNSSGFIRR